MKSAQGADKTGPLAGVPYDGKLTKADGKGLVVGRPRSAGSLRAKPRARHETELGLGSRRKGSSVPDAAYMEKFFNRTQQLWDDYQPDRFISTTACCRFTASRTKSA